MIVLEEDKDYSSITSSLAENGIGASAGSVAGHCLSVYRKNFVYRVEDLPVSAKLSFQGLALPLHPQMHPYDGSYCAKTILDLVNALRTKKKTEA
jgi:dTDP-4-amino-4,6-dideoxygalactose transaminase